MPGSNTRAMEKARILPADVVIFDLEDAVAPDAKVTARAAVASTLLDGGFGARERWIRVNPLNSEWGRDDLRMVIEAHPDGVLLPKVGDADDILAINEQLSDANLHGEIAIWGMIETPMGVLNCSDIAACAATTRLAGLVVGSNDLYKELRAESDVDRSAIAFALAAVITAARAHNIDAIDGVYNAIGDLAGLEYECLQGRRLGFDGKSVIHPSQLDSANQIFKPSDTALKDARAVCAAFDDPANQGKGVIRLNGKMVELLHLAEAQRLLSLDAAIAALEANNAQG